MKSNSIRAHAAELAKEISERRIYNTEEITTLICLRFDDAIKDFIREYSNDAEEKYFKLLDKQHKLNRKSATYNEDYFIIGQQLARLKREKALANYVSNNIQKQDETSVFRQFIIENHGKEVLQELRKKVQPHS